MKTLYIILFIVINIFSKTSHAQWVKLNTDSVHYYTGIYFLNKDTGFVCGEHSQVSTYLSTVLRTINGGYSWDTVKFGYSTNFGSFLHDIFFVNDSTGYTGGQDSELYKTTNMGATWNYIGSCLSPIDFSNFYFLNSDTAIIHGFDGDVRWYTPQTSPICYPYQYTQTYNDFPGTGTLDFIDYNTGYVAGGNGKFFKTFDRGATWSAFNCDTTINVFAAKMTDQNHAVVAGKNGKYSVTNDGGLSWSFPLSMTHHHILGVAFYNNQYGIAVGGFNGIYHWSSFGPYKVGSIWSTSDGGNTWSLVDSSYSDQLTDIHIVNDSLAFAVGLNGLVLRNQSHFSSLSNIPENNESINFSVFPNPFSGEINIYFPSALSENHITLFDLSGKLIYSHKVTGSNYKIKTSHLSKGVYFIKIITDHGVATRKLVKVK